MGFLSQFLNYRHICIQCHNNPDPDTLASALGLYEYFTENGIDTDIIYGGAGPIKKRNVLYMLEACEIPARYVTQIPTGVDILIVVDCQYNQGNVQHFDAPIVGVIDHHMQVIQSTDMAFIDNSYQSCSTIIWRMLEAEGYDVKNNYKLCVALLYGLYTDTASYGDLFNKYDIDMRSALSGDYPELIRLKKSCMTIAELMIAGDALHNLYVDMQEHFAIISAIHCDQSVLGIIGDMAIQVDILDFCITYTDIGHAYQISIRSCDKNIPANEVAGLICKGLGNGGGHLDKAGGCIFQNMIDKEYKGIDIHDILLLRAKEAVAEYKKNEL